MATDQSIEILFEHGMETVLIQAGYVVLSPGLHRILAPEVLRDLIATANDVADDLDNLASSLDLIETMKTAFMQSRADQFAREIKGLKGYGPKTEDLRRFLVDQAMRAASVPVKVVGEPLPDDAEGEADGQGA